MRWLILPALCALAVVTSAAAAPLKTINLTPGHCVTLGTTRVCAVAAKPAAAPATQAVYYATVNQAQDAITALGSWNGIQFASAFYFAPPDCFGDFSLTQHHNAAGQQTFASFKCVLVIDPDQSGDRTFDLVVTTKPDGTFSIKPA